MDPLLFTFVMLFGLLILYGILKMAGRFTHPASPPTAVLTSSTTAAEEPMMPGAQPRAENAPIAATPIATPRNEITDPVIVAENATIKALAIMITESRKKSLHEGRVPEAKGLEWLFNVKRSGDPKSEYQRLRVLLQKELDQLKPPDPKPQYPPLTPEQQKLREQLELEKG
jgi:hypothetical protein